jgi:hypothetical protein
VLGSKKRLGIREIIMTRFAGMKLLLCVLGISIAAAAATADSTAIGAAHQGTPKDMIVILRDQLEHAPPLRHAMQLRAAAVAAAHSSLINELQLTRPRNVHSFSTINAFATSLTAEETTALAARADVLAVVPDLPIHARKVTRQSASQAIPVTLAAASGSASTAGGLCNTLEPEALQVTNTAFADPSVPQAQSVMDGNGQPVTGKGVTVAYIADGLDPNLAGFIHSDGSKVFVAYEDFTGDPAGTPTAGGEAFGDASSIAAQDMPNGKPLLFDISKYVVPAHPLPSPCQIRIRGMAPGASLVGLNVFSSLGFTSTSNFVQAIEWAVTHDVDVINESFGGNPYPDNDNDPVSLADAAAIRAGVTVVVSTGDAGTAGTLGSPSTDPNVIAAGGTNTWRIYAQTNNGAIPLTPHKGVVNNNISALSSGGFAQTRARTVDVVAPADSGWALCSTNVTLFTDCFDLNGNPSPVEAFGGTSESSPLTAGEAALVIQAYRSTHHGVDPSPALVKQIIMSTATDLGAPAAEQGAGLINSLAAVNEALSIDDSHGSPRNRGTQLIAAPNSALITDLPNTWESRSFVIGNPGTTTLDLTPTLETLGGPVAGANISLTLDPAKDPQFINTSGARRSYIKHTFTVPAGAHHLDAAIAFQIDLSSSDSPLVLFALIDPLGRQAAYSLPQGSGNGYGHVDVVSPIPGAWTVIVWTRPVGVAGSYSGPVQFNWSAKNYVRMGTVSPSRVLLAPGHQATVTARFQMPADPGDTSAAIRFENSASAGSVALPQLPFSLRTLIPISSTGGNFTGTLTGGNGRAGAGPTQTFEFNVPSGIGNMSLSLQVADNGYILEGVLIDPQGMPVSVQPSLDPAGNLQFGLQIFKANPPAGRWHFVLLQNYFASGNQTSLPFTARIGFNGARVAAAGLPNNAAIRLSASTATPVTIAILNTGTTTNAYFLDARRNVWAETSLPPLPNPTCTTTPTLPGTCAQFEVPTQSTSIHFSATSNVPIELDAFNNVGFLVGMTGSPEIFGRSRGNSAATALTEPEIPWGEWQTVPSEIGPYGATGAPTEPVHMLASVTTRKFDVAVSSDAGDFWQDAVLGTTSFAGGLLLGSGEAGEIHATIKPSTADIGKVITGFIYVDTFNGVVGTGDEVIRIPYAYTVEK